MSACDSSNWRETQGQLLYQPYQVVLARFGRPDGIDEKGRVFWLGPGAGYGGLLLTIREGAVMRVEWLLLATM